VFSEVISKCYKEVPLAINEFRDNYKHIYVSVITIRLEPIAPEYFQTVSKLLKVKVRVFSELGDVL
jgi:hypothetical protein